MKTQINDVGEWPYYHNTNTPLIVLSKIMIDKWINVAGKFLDIIHRGYCVMNNSKLTPKSYLRSMLELVDITTVFKKIFNYDVVTKSVGYLSPQIFTTRSDIILPTRFTNEKVTMFFMRKIELIPNEEKCNRKRSRFKSKLNYPVYSNSFNASKE